MEKSFFKDMLSDASGVSAKRTIGLLIAATLIISFFIAQLFGKLPPEYMFNSLNDTFKLLLGLIATDLVHKVVNTYVNKTPTITPDDGK